MCFFSCFSGNCCISVCAPCLSPCHFTPPRMRDPNFFMTSIRYPHTLTEPPKPSLLQANHHQVPMPLLISEAPRSPQMIPAGEPRTRPSSPGVPPSNSLRPPAALGLTQPRCLQPSRHAAGSWSLCCPPGPSGVLQSCFPASTGAGIIPPYVQDQEFPFTGFHETPASPCLQPGQAPLNNSTIIWCTSFTISPNQKSFSLHLLPASIIKGLMITDSP